VGEQVYPDVAWTYTEPMTLVAPVRDLVAFLQERVDAVFVDGERIERPNTIRVKPGANLPIRPSANATRNLA
jgi:hypothetical protein